MDAKEETRPKIENDPDPTNQAPAKTPGGSDSSSILIWLARDGPPWARIPAAVIALLVAVVPSLILVTDTVSKLPILSAGKGPGTQLQLAAAADVSGYGATLHALLAKPNLSDDDRKAIEHDLGDMEHELGHLTTPNDDVKWIVFEKRSSKDYFGYKLFPSDNCLLIARMENAIAKTQWLRDPISHGDHNNLLGNISDSEMGRASLMFYPYRFSSNSGFGDHSRFGVRERVHVVETQLVEVQGGCLNPHPWPYREWWGAPVNQCQQPIFRQWADGCLHVQMFDRCMNLWGPIVWQVCVPNHHP